MSHVGLASETIELKLHVDKISVQSSLIYIERKCFYLG